MELGYKFYLSSPMPIYLNSSMVIFLSYFCPVYIVCSFCFPHQSTICPVVDQERQGLYISSIFKLEFRELVPIALSVVGDYSHQVNEIIRLSKETNHYTNTTIINTATNKPKQCQTKTMSILYEQDFSNLLE